MAVFSGAFGGCSSEAYYDTRPVTELGWDATGLESARADLPTSKGSVCSIAMRCKGTIRDEPKEACAVAIAERDVVVYDGYAGVERRGRSSLNFPKANYSMELREVDGSTDVPTNLLGMGRDEDWLLDGMWVDRSLVRNQLSYDLFRSLDERRYAAESRYCTLTLNGKYSGIYRLLERPKRDRSRIDIPKDAGEGTSFVIKQDSEGELEFSLGLEDRWALISPNRASATKAQLDGVQRWLDALDDVLRGRVDDGSVFDYLERDAWVDWVLLQEFAKNIDAYKLSVHLFKAPEEPAHVLPWDMDLAYGQPIVSAGAPEPVSAPESSGWIGERTSFLRGLVRSEGFTDALAARWRVVREGPFSNANIAKRLDNYQDALADHLGENFERWPLDQITFAATYPAYTFPSRSSYEDEMNALRTWIDERLAWMDANIDNFEE